MFFNIFFKKIALNFDTTRYCVRVKNRVQNGIFCEINHQECVMTNEKSWCGKVGFCAEGSFAKGECGKSNKKTETAERQRCRGRRECLSATTRHTLLVLAFARTAPSRREPLGADASRCVYLRAIRESPLQRLLRFVA